MYSLAVIMFNGSGGGEAQRDIPSAAAMCAREASLGHVIAPPLAMLLPKKRLLLLLGEDARAAGRLGTTVPHVAGNQLTWLRFDLGQRTTVQTIFPTFRVRSR